MFFLFFDEYCFYNSTVPWSTCAITDMLRMFWGTSIIDRSWSIVNRTYSILLHKRRKHTIVSQLSFKIFPKRMVRKFRNVIQLLLDRLRFFIEPVQSNADQDISFIQHSGSKIKFFNSYVSYKYFLERFFSIFCLNLPKSEILLEDFNPRNTKQQNFVLPRK